eukprot:CAMPEP_0181500410 /NCGR_PEP_ID=MMETSP1110-20121109/55203_1 /TAXON_ID=174948 /ORGANISM="Symbiodinium sp., Strain CCMP421" /LENGTH=79 /DNA_ID=CAMNT_0023628713 /DNA_START=48 /DNA_END=287 /DNA_ORIENTATION=+
MLARYHLMLVGVAHLESFWVLSMYLFDLLHHPGLGRKPGVQAGNRVRTFSQRIVDVKPALVPDGPNRIHREAVPFGDAF